MGRCSEVAVSITRHFCTRSLLYNMPAIMRKEPEASAKGPQGRGGRGQRGRSWALTFFAKPEFVLDTSEIAYFVSGEEICPETKRQHWQSYIRFLRPKSMKQVKSLVDDQKVHCEIAKGSPVQNRDYCLKEGKCFREEGTMPSQGKRNDLIAFREHYRNSGSERQAIESDDMLPMIARYPRLANTLSLLYSVQRSRPTELHIYWGPTGTGKSWTAFEEAKKIGAPYFKPVEDRWWDGYEQNPAVIIEDFRGEIPLAMLLRLADRYPMRVPIKGGYKEFNSQRIYITSNLDIDDWFNSSQKGYDVSMAALRRRITKKVHFNKPYGT